MGLTISFFYYVFFFFLFPSFFHCRFNLHDVMMFVVVMRDSLLFMLLISMAKHGVEKERARKKKGERIGVDGKHRTGCSPFMMGLEWFWSELQLL